MKKIKVLIIGRENFQDTFRESYFPNSSISRCLHTKDIKSKCKDKDLIIVEEISNRQLSNSFISAKKYERDCLIIPRQAMNPFVKRFARKKDCVKIELSVETRVVFVWDSAWNKTIYLDNGISCNINTLEICQGKIEKSFLKRCKQKTPVRN